MGVYATGRQRTMIMTGSMFGSLYSDFVVPPGIFDWGISTYSASGCSGSMISSGEVGYGYWSFTLNVLAGTDITDPAGDTKTATGTFPSTGSESIDVSGTYSFSVDLEEFVEIDDSGVFPTYGGAMAKDPPTGTSARFFESLRVGGNITATATACGLTAYATKPITSADAAYATVDYYGALGATALGVRTVQTTTINGVLNGMTLGVPFSASTTDASANTGGGATVTSGGETGLASSCGMLQAPDKVASLNVAVRAMQDVYPATIGLDVSQTAGVPPVALNVSGGSATETITQQSYSASAELLGVSFPGPDVNQWQPVQLWIRPGVSGDGDTASLLALGEDTTAWRMLMRGFKWNAMTMTQAESMNVDNAPQTTNWTAGANTTLADSGSDALTATVSGGLGSLSSTLPIADSALTNANWLGVSFCGYRFLRVSLTGDDDDDPQPASIVIGSKQWDFTVGTTGYVDIDLCCPTNRPSSTDADDSQWTWNGPAPYSVNDGEAWGVSNVSTFTIKNLANGHEYLLSGIQLVRKDHVGMTFLPTFAGWLQAFPSVTIGSVVSTTYYRRARQADTDGRQSREDTDNVWIHTDDGHGVTTDTYLDVAISGVVAALHTGGVPPRDGWDATDLMPNPNIASPGTCTGGGTDPVFNCYLNSDLRSLYLFGSGAMFDGTRWTYGFDISCTGTATIPAQTLYDSVDWYPGCGDGWGWSGGAYGTTFPIAAAAILRGEAYGLIMNSDGEGIADVLVDIKDAATGLIDAGSGYSSSIGEYRTGLPCGKGLVSYKVTAESGSMPYPNLTGTFKTRHRSRFCFPGQHVPKCCDTLFCPTDFLFPFQPFAGDHTILPLDDYQQVPDVANADDKEKEKQPAGVS